MRLRLLVLAALLAAVTAVCSLLAIPNPLLPSVPFTLQVFAVCLTGLLLPPGWACAAQVVYLGLGVAGMPVFAGGTAGPAVLVSATGGFLWAYPLAAAACAAVAGTAPGRRAVPWRLGAGALTAIVVIYAGGLAGLVAFGHAALGLATLLGLSSFVPWDAAKALLAAVLAVRLRAALLRGAPG